MPGMPDTSPAPLATVIGGNIRRWRARHGLKQDDLARAMRYGGLRWTRSVVAAIETGRRELHLNEFLALPFATFAYLDHALTLPELLADAPPPPLTAEELEPDRLERARRTLARMSDPDAELPDEELALQLRDSEDVQLGPRFSVSLPFLRGLLAASTGADDLIWPIQEFPKSPADQRALTAAETLLSLGLDFQTWSDEEFDQAWAAAGGEAERRLAKTLEVDPVVIAFLARRLWGRTLDQERDARVKAAHHGQLSAAAERAARGQVTRTLRQELLEYLDHLRNTANPEHDKEDSR